MAARWKERLERLAAANREARERELREMTLDRAARILEGLLAQPLGKPRRRRRHPVSLSRRMKGKKRRV
jgi:hypothetical protein